MKSNVFNIISVILFTFACIAGIVMYALASEFFIAFILVMFLICCAMLIYIYVERPAPTVVGRANARSAKWLAIVDIALCCVLIFAIIIAQPISWLHVTFLSLLASGDLMSAIANYIDYKNAKG